MDDNEKAVAQAAHGAAAYIDAAAENRMLLVELIGRTPPDVALNLFPVVIEIAASLARHQAKIWAAMKQSFRDDTESAILEDLDPDAGPVE